MSGVFLTLLNMSITASWLILAVIVIRLLLKKAPKWISCALWALVPGFDVYLFRQVFSCEMLCFPRFLYVCTESFKTGAIFDFCHIASPTYILYFIVCSWNVVICAYSKFYNSYFLNCIVR